MEVRGCDRAVKWCQGCRRTRGDLQQHPWLLRAIRGRRETESFCDRLQAGLWDVEEAGLQDQTPGEGDVARWATTQIGGESVYGAGGPVMSAEDASLVVGKAVSDGMLVGVRAKEGTKCRGAIKENHNPQAMWVFS